MWPFTKYYSLLDSGILDGATDWHCHILPGVDDGIRTLGSALEVLAYYEQIGIREVWLTPHIMEDVPNEPAALKQRFAEFKGAYTGPIRLHLAAENMIDTLFDQRIQARNILTISSPGSAVLTAEAGTSAGSGTGATSAPGDPVSVPGTVSAPSADSISAQGAHTITAPGTDAVLAPSAPGTPSAPDIPGPNGDTLLVETSYFSPPMAFQDTLDEIRLSGLHPLLAHPERYVYMDRRDYERLKEGGIRFQLNLMSLVGMYGDTAAEKASRLLLDGMYDYFGSDLHRLAPWQHAINDKCLTKKEIAALQSLRARLDHPTL